MPAALVEPGVSMTAPQAVANQQIGEAFAREINDAVAAPSGDAQAVSQAWSDARAASNWRYKLLFGNAAFNRASISAGLDALSDD